MCLRLALERPDDVLAKGVHEGFEWMVIHNAMGYRCGYVKVPLGHPWHGKDYDDIDANVHGGLTFSDPDVPCDKGGPDNGHWLGFDCAHGGDAPEVSLMDETHRRLAGLLANPYGTVRSQSYVENECRDLCEQAAKAGQSS